MQTQIIAGIFPVGGGVDLSFGQLLFAVTIIPVVLLLIMGVSAVVHQIKRRIAGKNSKETLEERLQSGNVTLDEHLNEARRRGLLRENETS